MTVPSIEIIDGDPCQVVVNVDTPQQPQVVEVTTTGPQGPVGPPGPAGAAQLSELTDVDVTGRGEKSLLYYDAASGKWIGDSIQTIIEVTNGGNF